MKVVQLAYWLLWVAEPEARVLKGHTPKWQRYLKKEKQRSKLDEKLSPSQVQRVLSTIFSDFEWNDFLPKPQKNGKGRKEGQKQKARKKYKVEYKTKKKKKASEKANSS